MLSYIEQHADRLKTMILARYPEPKFNTNKFRFFSKLLVLQTLQYFNSTIICEFECIYKSMYQNSLRYIVRSNRWFFIAILESHKNRYFSWNSHIIQTFVSKKLPSPECSTDHTPRLPSAGSICFCRLESRVPGWRTPYPSYPDETQHTGCKNS